MLFHLIYDLIHSESFFKSYYNLSWLSSKYFQLEILKAGPMWLNHGLEGHPGSVDHAWHLIYKAQVRFFLKGLFYDSKLVPPSVPYCGQILGKQWFKTLQQRQFSKIFELYVCSSLPFFTSIISFNSYTFGNWGLLICYSESKYKQWSSS